MSESKTTAPASPPAESNTINVDVGADSDETMDDGSDVGQTQPQTQPKQYSPPQPDRNTFETQRAFLDSLQPINIEDVGEESRKCPICWKYFGEDSDPGYDNSEQPVRLRCGHVFGNKCLTNQFRVCESPRLSLHPLRFLRTDRGYRLGTALFDYHQDHAIKFRNELELFQKMLTDLEISSTGGLTIFDKYWQVIFLMILRHADPNLTGITLMENAIVLDSQRPSTIKNLDSAYTIEPQHLNASANGLNQTLADPGSPLPLPSASPNTGGGIVPYITDPLGYSNHVPTDDMPSQSVQVPASAQPSVTYTLPTAFAPPSSVDVLNHANAYLISASSSIDPSKTWQGVLTAATNLDKLSALQKQSVEQKKKLLQDMSSEDVAAFKYQLIEENSQLFKFKSEQLENDQRAMKRKALIAQTLVDVLAVYNAERTLISSANPCPPSRYLPDTDPLLSRSLDVFRKVYLMDRKEPGEDRKCDNAIRAFVDPHFQVDSLTTGEKALLDVIKSKKNFIRIQDPPVHPPKEVHVSKSVHAEEYRSTSYEIFPPLAPPSFDDEDVSRFRDSTLIILRSICPHCEVLDAVHPDLATPTELTWRTSKKISNSCPLCSKVLFKKYLGGY